MKKYHNMSVDILISNVSMVSNLNHSLTVGNLLEAILAIPMVSTSCSFHEIWLLAWYLGLQSLDPLTP